MPAFGVGAERSINNKPRLRGQLYRLRLTLAAGATQKTDNPIVPVVGIIVSVFTGVLDVYIGDYSGIGSSTPDYRFSPTGKPEQIWLPPDYYVFTLFAQGAQPLSASFHSLGDETLRGGA